MSTARRARLSGIDRLKVIRSVVPAITHVDYSARVQTVNPDRHGRYTELLERFEEKTGMPVVINTSFNVRGRADRPLAPSTLTAASSRPNMDVLGPRASDVLLKRSSRSGRWTIRRTSTWRSSSWI